MATASMRHGRAQGWLEIRVEVSWWWPEGAVSNSRAHGCRRAIGLCSHRRLAPSMPAQSPLPVCGVRGEPLYA